MHHVVVREQVGPLLQGAQEHGAAHALRKSGHALRAFAHAACREQPHNELGVIEVPEASLAPPAGVIGAEL